jgi:hypothetical protein
MTLNTLFYTLKPFIPRSIQIAIRRMMASRKRRIYADVWPIDPTAYKKPEGWQGWPEGKKFALVIQHDVDTQKGHDNCHKLMELEQRYGIKSLYSFVPERYKVSMPLIKELSDKGFSIAVHGLNHDGKLFSSEQHFRQSALKINRYMHEWDSVGFTSPSMHRNPDWMHILDMEHCTSSFDTDPFEPQPSGRVGTIFPFYMRSNHNEKGYVELPYTLPQDHLLFVILQEKNIDIWKRKLAWIVDKGGMALLNTHPDYMHFENTKLQREEYPVQLFLEFLDYIKTKYQDQYWQTFPREVAQFWVEKIAAEQPSFIRRGV